MIHPLIAAIQGYTEAVERGLVQPTVNCCPLCGEEPEGFRLHDRRKRVFLVLVERLVHEVLSKLPRWRCPLCSGSFTDYPPFALPHKRYVRECVFELVERYLDEEHTSYRKAVREEGLPVFYDSGDDAIDERSLAHSTLHRWFPFFAFLRATLREALRLVRARSAASTLLRRVFPVAPRKYRSDERRAILSAALRALSIDQEYRLLFGRSIFPDLATACGWS